MKVLIVGLGSIAKKHINAIQHIDSKCKLYALRRSSATTSVEGVTNLYSLEECRAIQFDFILISNPTSEHFTTIKMFSEWGIPLFIEKPLFSQVNKETEELVATIMKSNISTYVACNLRFLEALRFIKEKVKHERINEVNVYCGSYLPDWRPNVDFRTVYSANAEMGGGVHIDLIHELDYVYWLFGAPNAAMNYFSNKSSLSISAHDYANYLWKYNEFNVSIVLNYYRRTPKREIEIVTDQSCYTVDLLNNVVYKEKEVVFSHQNRIIDTYISQMLFFMEQIVQNKVVMNDINEANKILKLCMQE